MYLESGSRYIKEFTYSSLFDLAKTGNITQVGYYTVVPVDYTSITPITVTLSSDKRKLFVYEILGRLLHLLQDMSVPAHVHGDPHADLSSTLYLPCFGMDWCDDHDVFEEWLTLNQARDWDYLDAFNAGGLIPYNKQDDPLRFLFYSSNQIADIFSSNDKTGNTVLSNGQNDIINHYYGLLNNQIISNNQVGLTSSTNFVFSIRACATLLWWFAIETNMIKTIQVTANKIEYISVRNPARSISSSSEYVTSLEPYKKDFSTSVTVDLQTYWNENYSFNGWQKRDKNNTIVDGNFSFEWLNATADATATFVALYNPIVNLNLSSIVTEGLPNSFYYQNITNGEISNTFQTLSNYPITIKAVAPSQYNFMEWNDGHLENPRSFNLSSNTSNIYAVFKGNLLSNNLNSFITSGQRKVVRDEVGRLNMVYESMGFVWLTVSSDNGVNWSPEIKINYVEPSFNIPGSATKCPSIVQSDDNTGKVYIAYQFNYGDNSSGIAVSAYFNGQHRWTALVDDSNISYSYNCNPVIAVRNDILNVVYRKSALNGLYCTRISVDGLGNPVVSTPVIVPGTTASSSNPAITCGINTQGYYKFHLAYQEATTTINYFNWTPSASPSGTPLNVSSGSSYLYNTNPSIIQLGDGVRIAWKGYNIAGNAAAVFKDPDYSRFWNFDAGTGISSSSVTRTTDGNYLIGWTSQSGTSNRFVINSDFNNIRTFKTAANVNLAGNLQVANGSAFTDMYAMSLNTQTSPYSFQLSKKVSDIGIGKVGSEDITYTGRGAVVYKDNAEVYFSLNDITADGSLIGFVEAEDTLKITERGELNKYLETKPFSVNSNSEFIYGINYGTIDSTALAALLKENSFISFKVEMVDVKTNTVLSTLEDIEYSKTNPPVFGEKAVKVNLSEIGSKEIKLRITLSDNIDAAYTLVDKISTSENIAKTSIQEVKYTGVTVIKDYALEQNYPNPFNPSTTITYQLPKDGMVTLKIYDAIGTEVTTLVNEYKPTGRYNVTFNASNLASGVYFYRLQVNDFISSKKLILMK